MQVWMRIPPFGLALGSGGDLAVAQVPDRAGAQREHATEADAHPAARGHQHPGLLGGVQDRRGSVGRHLGARTGERHGAAVADDQALGPEPLGDQRQAAGFVVILQGIEQSGRATGQRGPLGQVGDQLGQVVHVETAVLVAVPADQPDHAVRVELPQVGQEDRVGGTGCDVQHDDVVRLRAREPDHAGVGDREQVAEHADHRGDAGAGGDEQEPATLGGEDEVTRRLLQVDQGARPALTDQVVADLAVRHRLDGDADPAVRTGSVGQRVGAPLTDPVHVDADPHVLAGDVARPVGARSDLDRGGVGGLGMDGHDPAAQVRAAAQGIEQVEVVGRQQRGRDPLRQSYQPLP